MTGKDREALYNHARAIGEASRALDNTEPFRWVRERMPIASVAALDRFTTVNPHWRGAGWGDCLATLIDSDSHLEVTEPLADASKNWPYPASLIESVSITLLYSDQTFAAADDETRAAMVLQTIERLS